MAWVTNANGLIEDHTPDNLLAYDNEPQFCRRFTKEEYELLYQMLDPQIHQHGQDFLGDTLRSWMFEPYIAGVIKLRDFDPDKVFEAIRLLPNNAPRIGYSFVKKVQSLLQQVADENLPLFLNIKGEDAKHTKVLKTILEWRFKCQRA